MAHIEPVSFEQYKAKALAQFKPSNAVDCTDWEGLYAEYLKRAKESMGMAVDGTRVKLQELEACLTTQTK